MNRHENARMLGLTAEGVAAGVGLGAAERRDEVDSDFAREGMPTTRRWARKAARQVQPIIFGRLL